MKACLGKRRPLRKIAAGGEGERSGLGEQLQFEDEEINITLRRAWDRALRSLSVRVNKPAFETHLRVLRPLSLSEGTDRG